jgi:hypothetical protein
VLQYELQLDRAPLAQGLVQNQTTDTPILITSTPAGITLDTRAVGSDKASIAAANFLEGTFFESQNPDAHLRVEGRRLYKVSFLVSASTPANNQAQIRLRTRSVKFQWNHSLVLGAARAVGSIEGQTIAAQILPGTGSLNPNTDPSGGIWYHQYVSSPLDPDIRADVAGTLAQKFPLLSAQPGIGDPAPRSFRNLRHGIDVIDGFSFGPGGETETAEITLRRIEVRSLPQPQTQAIRP